MQVLIKKKKKKNIQNVNTRRKHTRGSLEHCLIFQNSGLKRDFRNAVLSTLLISEEFGRLKKYPRIYPEFSKKHLSY